MALRNIRIEGDPILRKNSKDVKEVNERTKVLIGDMIETLKDANGVGLAAVQVGVLKKLCIICIAREDIREEDEPDACAEGYTDHTNGEPVVVINPEITYDGDEMQTGNEGCLSVPGKYGEVTRHMRITLKALDINMQPYELKAEGLLARAICHEYDHMFGIIYIDKVEGELHTSGEEEEQED